MCKKKNIKITPKLPNLAEQRDEIKRNCLVIDLTCALQDKDSKNNDTIHSLKLLITSYAFNASNVYRIHVYIL